MDLVVKAATGQKITNKDIEQELYEICDREHSSCSDNCPVYALQNEAERNADECPHHKDGKSMRKFIVGRVKHSKNK